MPRKQQQDCYRTINGERYVNMCDVHGREEQDYVDAAKRIHASHRLVKHKDGFRILFVWDRDYQRVVDEVHAEGRRRSQAATS